MLILHLNEQFSLVLGYFILPECMNFVPSVTENGKSSEIGEEKCKQDCFLVNRGYIVKYFRSKF